MQLTTDVQLSKHVPQPYPVHRRGGSGPDAIPLRHELIFDLPVRLMLPLRVPLGQQRIHLIDEQHTG